MKIAIIHNLPAGGQKRALFEQVKRLSKKHTLDLYTLSCANESFLPLNKYAKDEHIFSFNYPSHFPKSVASIYFQLPQVYKKMAGMINSYRYNAAYVNPCFLTQAPFVLRYLKIPSLYYCPEPKREFYELIPRMSNKLTYFLTYPFRYPIKYIDAANTSYATRIITNSNYSKGKIDKIYGVSSFVNYLGVDTRLFHTVNGEKENFVLSVGDVSLHKGHDFLIKSISLIPVNLRPELTIVGHGGTESKYLTALASQMHVKLQIINKASDRELVMFYNRAKAFVYASLSEPFGLSILEAAACNLPIVAVNEGGAAEIIKSEDVGFLTKRNPSDFADALEKILKKSSAFALDTKKSEYIKNTWNWEKSVADLNKHLEEIIL